MSNPNRYYVITDDDRRAIEIMDNFKDALNYAKLYGARCIETYENGDRVYIRFMEKDGNLWIQKCIALALLLFSFYTIIANDGDFSFFAFLFPISLYLLATRKYWLNI